MLKIHFNIEQKSKVIHSDEGLNLIEKFQLPLSLTLAEHFA